MKTNSYKKHEHFLRAALAVAENCSNIEWYGVGCVIVDREGTVLSTGYTGELSEQGSMCHAEEVALRKLIKADFHLSGADVTLYSTLEPCSIRASGKMPCCQHIISSQIATVVYGAKEPYDENLGIVCRGALTLQKSGIEVIQIDWMQEQCLTSVLSKRSQ